MNIEYPSADKWVKSPLRNSVKLKLNAPISKVWEVVNNPAKVLLSCADINRVEIETNKTGVCTAYTCIYKPLEEEATEVNAHSKILWSEINKGWASLDDEPHPFGFKESLALMTLKEEGNNTSLNWFMYYDIENNDELQMTILSLDKTLKDEIAQYLILTFGGFISDN